MSNKDEIKEVLRKTTSPTRRNAEFNKSFLDYHPGIGKVVLDRITSIFPTKVKLSPRQKTSFMIDLAWSSSKLEGNSYSHLETIKLLTYGTRPSSASDRDTQMIINHSHAFDLIRNSSEVSLGMLEEIHRCLADPGEIEGETEHFVKKNELGLIRETESMTPSHTAYAQPSFSPGRGSERIYDLIGHVMKTANEIVNPVESAFYILTRVPYVQAFFGVNKRTSRVMANVPLLSSDCMPISYEIMACSDYLEAIMSVYEFADTDILKDVFIQSYADSYLKYHPMPRSLDDEVRLNLLGYQKDLSKYILDGVKSKKVDFFLSEMNGLNPRKSSDLSDLEP